MWANGEQGAWLYAGDLCEASCPCRSAGGERFDPPSLPVFTTEPALAKMEVAGTLVRQKCGRLAFTRPPAESDNVHFLHWIDVPPLGPTAAA